MLSPPHSAPTVFSLVFPIPSSFLTQGLCAWCPPPPPPPHTLPQAFLVPGSLLLFIAQLNDHLLGRPPSALNKGEGEDLGDQGKGLGFQPWAGGKPQEGFKCGVGGDGEVGEGEEERGKGEGWCEAASTLARSSLKSLGRKVQPRQTLALNHWGLSQGTQSSKRSEGSK